MGGFELDSEDHVCEYSNLNVTCRFRWEEWKMKKGRVKKKEYLGLPNIFFSQVALSFLFSSEMIKPFNVDTWQLL